jgi:predicted permease
MEGAAARLDVLSRQLSAVYPSDNRNLEFTTGRLSRLSLSTGPQDNTAIATFTGFLLTLSGLVLVIACLNIANMLLARGAARRKEIAVRLALGAKRSRVIRQLLTESLLLAATGAALGLVFSYWAMRIFLSSLGTTLPFTLSLNPTPNMAVLTATVVFAAIGTVAFGLGPALGLSRRDLVSDLKDRSQAGAGSARRFTAKNTMVIAQVALSLALLTAGGVFTRTTVAAAAGRPGYEYDGLLLARIDTKLAGLDTDNGTATYRELLMRARSQSGVTAATVASSIPFGDSQDGRLFERVGAEGRQPARARAYRTIGADYFASLGLRLLKGREFTAVEESSALGPRVAIIDEALARGLFDGEDPIGQMIRVARNSGDVAGPAGEPMEIVGVAPAIREELLDHKPAGHVYVPFGRNYRSDMYIQARMAPGADERAGLDRLRSTIREINPRVPVLASATMQAFHDDSLELWALRTASATFTALGVIALLIASIGVYGVRAYIVAQRTREIGIRMALGAGAAEVLKLVLKDGAFLTIAGLAIGLPLALLASIALRSVFVDVGGVDLVVIAVASIALAVAVTLAGAVPARRATKVEALTALRTE